MFKGTKPTHVRALLRGRTTHGAFRASLNGGVGVSLMEGVPNDGPRTLVAQELRKFLERSLARQYEPITSPVRTFEQDADDFIAGLNAAGHKIVENGLVCIDFDLAHHAAQAITDLVECLDSGAGSERSGESSAMTIASFEATRQVIWD